MLEQFGTEYYTCRLHMVQNVYELWQFLVFDFLSPKIANIAYPKNALWGKCTDTPSCIILNKISKEDSECIYLSIILIDSVYKNDKIYYPQVLWEECKYVFKRKKTSKFIIDDIEILSDDSDRESSDAENSNEKK